MTGHLPVRLGLLLYALGVIAVQAHLARYGIGDVGLLDINYFAVGGWVILSSAPSLAIVGILEAWRSDHARVVTPVALLLLLVVVVALVRYQWTYDLIGSVFDFGAYPYPLWFILWDVGIWNGVVVAIWVLMFLLRKLEIRAELVSQTGLWFTLALLGLYSVFFGRVVYPALSPAVGGGAPQFATIESDGAVESSLIVYMTSDIVCYLPLSSFPQAVERRHSRERFLELDGGPVWDAVALNRVAIRNRSTAKIVLFGFSQREILDRY